MQFVVRMARSNFHRKTSIISHEDEEASIGTATSHQEGPRIVR